MSKQLVKTLESFFEWHKVEYILIITSAILFAVINLVINVHPFIIFTVWALLAFKSIRFASNNSLTTVNTANGSHFSWKFLQGLPLTRENLVKFIVTCDLIICLPMLIVFILSFKYITAFDLFNEMQGLNLIKVTVNFLIVWSILSVRRIDGLIEYPRVEFKNKTKNNVFVTYAKWNLIVFSFIVLILILSSFIEEITGVSIIKILLEGIVGICEFLTTWWFPPIGILLYMLSCKRTLKKWGIEKKPFSFFKSNLKNDWITIGVCLLFLSGLSVTVDLDTPTGYKDNKLNVAVYKKDYKEIENLLAENYDIHKANKHGFNPMFVAIHEGNLEMIKFLEKHGANFNGSLKKSTGVHNGYNALLVAIDSKNLPTLKYVSSRGYDLNSEVIASGINPIQLAAKLCTPELIDFLVEKGADVNAINKEGQTAMHFAIKHNCMTGTMALRDQGASFNIADKNGKKASDLLGKNSNSDLKYFVDKQRKPASQQP